MDNLENTEENSEKIGKIWKKGKLKSENILKMWKKIVKWYEKYGRKVIWNVNWRKIQLKIVIRYGKYGKKSKLNSEMLWKI